MQDDWILKLERSELANADQEKPHYDLSPEFKLVLCVIERAIIDACGDKPRIYQDALEWLFLGDVGRPPRHSLKWFCDLIELDIDLVRAYAMDQIGDRATRVI